MLPVVLHLALFVSFALSSTLPAIDRSTQVNSNCRLAHFTAGQKLYLDPCYNDPESRTTCHRRILVEDMRTRDRTLFFTFPTARYDGMLNSQEQRSPCTPILALFGSILLMLGNCSSDDMPVGAYYPLFCSPTDLSGFYDHYTTLGSGHLQLNCTRYLSEEHQFTVDVIWFHVTWEENGDASYDVCDTRCNNHTVRGRTCPYFYDFNVLNEHSPPGILKDKPPAKKFMLGGFVLLTILASIFFFFFSLFSCRRPKRSILLRKKISRRSKRLEDLLQEFQNLMPTRYDYSDVVKITSSFSHKLGRGGYGSVYRGSLRDGRAVAVKVLRDDTKGSVKDFLSEVVAIGCTYHVNIVSLLGFCSEGPNRVLIYEFMPNGSLEKFIYRDEEESSLPSLGPEKLLDIAIGVARGLEYLHHGCNVGILHFDIKPHNILLDEDLRPKIADFGLAKLCQSADSRIRLLGARGTVGYIAPEVFSRRYGGVSSKSDVYSYGMMILEMVGGRKKLSSVRVDRRNTSSEVCFPHWICKHLDLDGKLIEPSLISMAGDEEVNVRRMVMVGLWCIQTKPSDRPSMTKVLDILEGRMTELQMPPMPVLSSPPRSPLHSPLTIPSLGMLSTVTLPRN